MKKPAELSALARAISRRSSDLRPEGALWRFLAGELIEVNARAVIALGELEPEIGILTRKRALELSCHLEAHTGTSRKRAVMATRGTRASKTRR